MAKLLDQHHEDIIKSFYHDQHLVFESSDQAMFVYLDDVHKMCNQKFADLLGYRSPDEWSKVEHSFPDAFVEKNSRATMVSAYQDVVERRVGVTIDVTWMKKTKGAVDTSVTMVPLVHKGHLLVLHFVSKNKG